MCDRGKVEKVLVCLFIFALAVLIGLKIFVVALYSGEDCVSSDLLYKFGEIHQKNSSAGFKFSFEILSFWIQDNEECQVKKILGRERMLQAFKDIEEVLHYHRKKENSETITQMIEKEQKDMIKYKKELEEMFPGTDENDRAMKHLGIMTRSREQILKRYRKLEERVTKFSKPAHLYPAQEGSQAYCHKKSGSDSDSCDDEF